MTQLFKYILVAAVAILTLSSCNQDEPAAVGNHPIFSATIEGAGSRARDTSWGAGDKIGITGGDAVNISHVTDAGDGNFTVSDPSKQIFFQNGNLTDFIAYYPYNSSVTAANPVISITSNIVQTNQANFDFLWASGKGSRSNPHVKFNFAHKMSKITLVLEAGDDMDLSTVTQLSTSGFYLKGTFNTSNGNCVATGATATTNLALSKPSSGVVCPIIVFPQVLKKNPVEFTVTATAAGVGTITGSLTFDNDTLKSGKNYQFNIKVCKTGINVKSSTIKDWDEVDLGNIDI